MGSGDAFGNVVVPAKNDLDCENENKNDDLPCPALFGPGYRAISRLIGGDGVGRKTDYVVNAQPGGIWSGTDSVTGLAIVALVG